MTKRRRGIIWDTIGQVVSLILAPILVVLLDRKYDKRARDAAEESRQLKEDTDRRINKKDVDTQAAVQALLRDKIVDKHREYMLQGYVGLYSRDSLNRMYIEYKNLGGNSVVDMLMGELDKLPTIDPTDYQ